MGPITPAPAKMEIGGFTIPMFTYNNLIQYSVTLRMWLNSIILSGSLLLLIQSPFIAHSK
jgi:hypothetical protein